MLCILNSKHWVIQTDYATVSSIWMLRYTGIICINPQSITIKLYIHPSLIYTMCIRFMQQRPKYKKKCLKMLRRHRGLKAVHIKQNLLHTYIFLIRKQNYSFVWPLSHHLELEIFLSILSVKIKRHFQFQGYIVWFLFLNLY